MDNREAMQGYFGPGVPMPGSDAGAYRFCIPTLLFFPFIWRIRLGASYLSEGAGGASA